MDKIVLIIIIAQQPCVAPILSVSILTFAFKDRSFIKIIAISISNVFQDAATTTYALISRRATKNALQILTVLKQPDVALKDSAPTKKFA